MSFNFNNGADPNALTLRDDGTFYGTTRSGGTNGPDGTLFRMTSDGLLNTLASFDSIVGSGPSRLTPGEDGIFYGTTESGIDGSGMVFKADTNGVLNLLAYFNGNNGFSPTGLTCGMDGNLYGTTLLGGTNGGVGGQGTVFQVRTNGALASLFSFNGFNGSQPGSLALGDGGQLYGTTYEGGRGNLWTIFVMTLPPSIFGLRTNSNALAFNVQSTANSTNLVWFSANAAAPVSQWQVVSTNEADARGRFSDTNLANYSTKFYRVSRL